MTGMFYADVVLAHKGPLGKIWLAAHFDRKLSKHQIFSTDIAQSVDTLLNPNLTLTLRVSGNLMLGIVRIYSKKMKYLMVDCSEAMWKIKLALKPGQVDMDAAAANIDDQKNYGNLAEDLEFSQLDEITFAPQLLPLLSISRLGYLDEDSVFTETDSLMDENSVSRSKSITNLSLKDLSVVSEMEEVRGAPSVPLFAAETPLSMDRLSQQFFQPAKFDDDLPQFEEKNDLPLSQLSFSFTPAAETAFVSTFDPIENEPLASEGNEVERVEDTNRANEVDVEVTNEATVAEEKSPTRRAKPRPKQKKKVLIDERIEISDKEFAQYVSDPMIHLRKNSSSLKASKSLNPLSFRPDFYTHGLCDELVEIVQGALNINPFDLPLKRRKVDLPVDHIVEKEHSQPNAYPTPEEKRKESLLAAASNRISYDGQSLANDSLMRLQPGINKEMQPLSAADQINFSFSDSQGFLNTTADNIIMEANPSVLENQTSTPAYEFDASLLRYELESQKKIALDDIIKDGNKSFASRCFLEVLQLKSQNLVELQQDSPFSTIFVTKI